MKFFGLLIVLFVFSSIAYASLFGSNNSSNVVSDNVNNINNRSNFSDISLFRSEPIKVNNISDNSVSVNDDNIHSETTDTVNENIEYPTIDDLQDVVNKASNNDTIYVPNSISFSQTVIVNKNLTFVGTEPNVMFLSDTVRPRINLVGINVVGNNKVTFNNIIFNGFRNAIKGDKCLNINIVNCIFKNCIEPVNCLKTLTLSCTNTNFHDCNNSCVLLGDFNARTDLSHCTFSNNNNLYKPSAICGGTSGVGGAVTAYNVNSNMRLFIDDCNFTKNHAVEGGAIYFNKDKDNLPNKNATKTMIRKLNEAGVYDLEIKNTMIKDNTATNRGGALFVDTGYCNINIEGNTVVNNKVTTVSDNLNKSNSLKSAGGFLFASRAFVGRINNYNIKSNYFKDNNATCGSYMVLARSGFHFDFNSNSYEHPNDAITGYYSFNNTNTKNITNEKW